MLSILPFVFLLGRFTLRNNYHSGKPLFAVKMNQDYPIPTFVVFGRPGSGKSTVANAAVEILTQEKKILQCLALDLDVCVPQWMRDNFAKGIYPSLQERQDFALSCCEYVNKRFAEIQCNGASFTNWVSIISFSFVNKDLRDSFRSRFPSAQWILVETDETEAAQRISQREGHFYKGKYQNLGEQEIHKKAAVDGDNSEWNFATVDFPHVVLDGTHPIESNAATIVRLIEDLAFRGDTDL